MISRGITSENEKFKFATSLASAVSETSITAHAVSGGGGGAPLGRGPDRNAKRLENQRETEPVAR
eukprot:2832032-Pyramimonas_sp.AAC.1